MLSGRKCVAFLQIGGEVTCSPDEIDSIVSLANVRYSWNNHKPVRVCYSLSLSLLCSDSVFEFDHIHSSSLLGSRPLAVLYAQLGTTEFEQFHDKLISLSNSGQVVYALRHYIKVFHLLDVIWYFTGRLFSPPRIAAMCSLCYQDMEYSSPSRVQSTKQWMILKSKVSS
jgi:hypothetical protein